MHQKYTWTYKCNHDSNVSTSTCSLIVTIHKIWPPCWVLTSCFTAWWSPEAFLRSETASLRPESWFQLDLRPANTWPESLSPANKRESLWDGFQLPSALLINNYTCEQLCPAETLRFVGVGAGITSEGYACVPQFVCLSAFCLWASVLITAANWAVQPTSDVLIADLLAALEPKQLPENCERPKAPIWAIDLV